MERDSETPAGVVEWQTQETQNLPPIKRAGSIPAPGTRFLPRPSEPMSDVPASAPAPSRAKRRTAPAIAAAVVAAIAAAASWMLPPRPAPEEPAEPHWTVASWNMEWFPSGYSEVRPAKDEERRIRAAARAFRRQGVPDVLLAQEIRDAETCRKFLARLGDPRLRLAVCSDFWFDPTNRGLQQVAILSRLPVRRAGFERWAAADFVYPPRGFSWAVIDVGPTNVAFFDVHLKSNYIPEDQDVERQTVLNRLKREIAARQLLARIDELAPGVPAVVAGDFNTALEDERFAEEGTIRIFLDAGFRDAFEGIPEADRPTLTANDFYPPATFDHILVRGLPSPLARSVGADIRTSDHRPLRASFPLGEFAR